MKIDPVILINEPSPDQIPFLFDRTYCARMGLPFEIGWNSWVVVDDIEYTEHDTYDLACAEAERRRTLSLQVAA